MAEDLKKPIDPSELMKTIINPDLELELSQEELITALQQKLSNLYIQNNIKTKRLAPDVIKQIVNLAFSDITDYIEQYDPAEDLADEIPEELDENGNPIPPKPRMGRPPKKKVSGQSIRLKSLMELTDEQRAAIESIEQTKSGIKFKLHNKIPALDLLTKHFGLLIQRFEHTGADGGPIEVNQNTRVYVVPAFAQAAEEATVLQETNHTPQRV